MRTAFVAVMSACAFVMMANPAQAVVIGLDTAQHPNPSNLSLSLYLGDPNLGGIPLVTLPPINVTGTANADITLTDPSDSGTLQFLGSSLVLDNFGPTTVAIGAFGTADISAANLEVDINSGSIPVVTNNFSINSGTAGSMDINQGTIVLANTTGLLAALLPTGTTINFATNPINLPFSSLGSTILSGTTDDDGGQFDNNGAEVNLPLDVAVPALEITPGTFIYAKLVGSLNVGSAVIVPEVGSMMLLALGSVGLGCYGMLRRRTV